MKFNQVLVIIMVLLIFGSIFMKKEIFYGIGSIGGIVFLIRTLLGMEFPNLFKEDGGKR